MEELVSAALRLRQVRQAERQFLAMWLSESSTNASADDVVPGTELEMQHQKQMRDPDDRNWRHLYRGSVLDD